jgi:DNA-binding transcriptional LysR family regulator
MKHLFAKTGLSFERLRSFAEIVRATGISNAAPGDSNRQSQFSRQLKELEEFFGAELLRRGHGQFELTPAGRELFQIVQSHFNAMEDLADRCANQNMEVTVGGGESLLHWLLLPGLTEFRAKHSTITLVLENLRTEETTSRLADGRIDMGLVRQDAVCSPLKSARLGTIEYRLVVPRDSSKAKSTKTGWAMLARRPVAVLAGSKVTAAFETEAERKGVRLDVCLRGSSYAQLIEAARQIRCATVLPTFTTRSLEAESDIFPLSALKAFTRAMALAWNPRSCALRPAMASAIESLTIILRRRLSSTA